MTVIPIEIVITGCPRDSSFFERTFLRRLMDARIKSGHDGRVLRGEVKGRFTHTFFNIFKQQKTNPHARSRSRGAMRPSHANFFHPHRGRGECRVPAAPAVSCALCIGRTHTSNNEYTGTPGIPARNGFTAYVALSPVTGLFCHRRLADIVLSLPGWANKTPQNLTPASGRQDHTILPSAAIVSRQRAGDRSQVPENPPCDPIARQTLPRPPHPAPTSVTIMIRPSCGVGWPEF
jgi:hypothetical protein